MYLDVASNLLQRKVLSNELINALAWIRLQPHQWRVSVTQGFNTAAKQWKLQRGRWTQVQK